MCTSKKYKFLTSIDKLLIIMGLSPNQAKLIQSQSTTISNRSTECSLDHILCVRFSFSPKYSDACVKD